MRLGIVSDIHDHLHHLMPAIRYLNENADVLLCCGDLCSPFVIDELAKFHRPVHVIFGNNDADLFRITKKSNEHVRIWGEFFDMELEGRRIAANHFDYLARPIARSGVYDLVCFGHNHRLSHEQFGRTLALNPGSLMGTAFGPNGPQQTAATFVVCDIPTLTANLFEVEAAEGERPIPGCRQSSWP